MSNFSVHHRVLQVLRDPQASDQMHQAPFYHFQTSKIYRLALSPL